MSPSSRTDRSFSLPPEEGDPARKAHKHVRSMSSGVCVLFLFSVSPLASAACLLFSFGGGDRTERKRGDVFSFFLLFPGLSFPLSLSLSLDLLTSLDLSGSLSLSVF